MLTHKAIKKLIRNGVVKNVHPDQVNPASLDVTLGDILLVEDCCGQDVDPLTRQGPRMRRLRKVDGKWRLKPGVFALCSTREIFNMPDDLACMIQLKSSIARCGIDHKLAGFVDPGFNNAVVTLELTNDLECSDILLTPGMRIAQAVFFKGKKVPPHASYRHVGRYNGCRITTETKGL